MDTREPTVNKLLTLPSATHAKLAAVSTVRDTPVSALIRTAIDFWLQHGAPVPSISSLFPQQNDQYADSQPTHP